MLWTHSVATNGWARSFHSVWCGLTPLYCPRLDSPSDARILHTQWVRVGIARYSGSFMYLIFPKHAYTLQPVDRRSATINSAYASIRKGWFLCCLQDLDQCWSRQSIGVSSIALRGDVSLKIAFLRHRSGLASAVRFLQLLLLPLLPSLKAYWQRSIPKCSTWRSVVVHANRVP